MNPHDRLKSFFPGKKIKIIPGLPGGDQDQIFVLCFTVKECPVPVIRGARKDQCATCKTPVWVAPATDRNMKSASAPYMFLCGPCCNKRIGKTKTLRVYDRTPEQVAEMDTNVLLDFMGWPKNESR